MPVVASHIGTDTVEEQQGSSPAGSAKLMLSVLEQGRSSQQDLDAHTARLVKDYAEFNDLKNKEAEYIQIQLAIELRKLDFTAHHLKQGAAEAQPEQTTPSEEQGIVDKVYSALGRANNFLGTDVVTDKISEAMTPVETQFEIPQVKEIMDLSEEEFATLAYNNDIKLNQTQSNLEEFRRLRLSRNPYDPGPHGKDDLSMAEVMYRHDLALLIGADLSLRDLDTLESASKKLDKGAFNGEALPLLEGLIEINRYRNSLPQWLFNRSTEAEAILDAHSRNESEALHRMTESFVAPLQQTEWLSSKSNELQLLQAGLSQIRPQSFERFGFRVSRSSEVFSEDAMALMNLSVDEVNALDPKQKQRAIILQNTFWDTHIPWEQTAHSEADIRLANTSYATLKRLSELVSAFQTKINEVESSNLNNSGKAKARADAVEGFWSLVSDTTKRIDSEAKVAMIRFANADQTLTEALSNQDMKNAVYKELQSRASDSPAAAYSLKVIQNAIQHGQFTVTADIPQNVDARLVQETADTLSQLSYPYHALSETISGSTKLRPDYSIQDLSSGAATFEKSIIEINHAFKAIHNFVHNAGAGTNQVENLLDRFLEANSSHPEFETLKGWSKHFQTRFKDIFDLY